VRHAAGGVLQGSQFALGCQCLADTLRFKRLHTLRHARPGEIDTASTIETAFREVTRYEQRTSCSSGCTPTPPPRHCAVDAL
jgi:hypothetical protein